MVNTSKLSKYLKVENVRDGDLITFIDPGVIIDREFKDQKSGIVELKPVLEITVDYKGDKKTYSPNTTTTKLLNKAWGAETEKWVSKQARINILPASNGRDTIVAKPLASGGGSPEDIQFNN